MHRDRQTSKAKVGTIEDFEEYRRRGGGGGNGDDDGPRSLWQIFNDKISDMTQEFRANARNVVRAEQIRLEEQFKAASYAENDGEHHKVYKQRESDLFQTRTKISNGGVKGAVAAAKVLWFGAGRPVQNP